MLEVKQNDPFIALPEGVLVDGIAETTKDTPTASEA